MKKTKVFLFIYIMISVLFISIVYSSFNTNLYINGVGVIRAQADVRINGINNPQYVGEAIENFNPNYNIDRLNISVNLPTEESSISYGVVLKNYSNKVYISSIELESEVSENVIIQISDGNNTYNLPNDDLAYELNINEEKTYTLTIKNKNGTTNNNVLVTLKFNYVYDTVTAPIIELSNDGDYVQLLSSGESTFSVDHYEYFISETNDSPNEQSVASGTTDNALDLSIVNYDNYYVWYRTVSTKGTKSVWSNSVEVSLSVKITYISNGGSSCSSKSVTKGHVWGSLCSSLKDGYILEGWYTDNGTFNNIIRSSTIANSSITVYAKWVENIYVAKLNDKYYVSIMSAINDYYNENPNDENEITIKLLKNTTELITVDAGRNILLDLQEYTINNVTGGKVIDVYGTVKMINGTIITDAGQGAINVNSSGRFEMSGGRIESTGGTKGKQAIYNDGGTVIISGDAYLISNSTIRACVQNQSGGNLTITGGTIISSAYYGLDNKGTLTLGIHDGVAHADSPLIQGVNYGIYTTSGASINYYDGVIKGLVAINNEGRIVDKEQDVSISRHDEVINGETYKVITLSQPVLVKFNPNGGTVTEETRNVFPGNSIGILPYPTRNGYVFEGWFTKASGGVEITSDEIITQAIEYYAQWTDESEIIVARIGENEYHSLQAAINSVPKNNEEVTVHLTRSIKESITVSSGQNINLDLQSYTLTNKGNKAVIDNSGTIKINNGTITSDNNTACIDNNASGILIMSGGSIIATGTRQAIYNYGEVYISGNSYISSKATGKPSSGTLERATLNNLEGAKMTIVSGTIIGVNQQAISNAGLLTLGTKDGNIDSTNPIIIGNTYGIKTIGTFDFYDGIIKGITDAISGTVSDNEENSTIINGTEVINKKTYKTNYYEFE